MLPVKPPGRSDKLEILDLGKEDIEIPEVEQDQFYEQVQAINAKNQRIKDIQAGIVTPTIEHDQIPVDKTKLKQKAPSTSTEWNPYD